MERTATVAIFALLFAAPASPQDAHLPPDLIHIDRVSCTIVQHGVGEVLDAKTNQVKALLNYRAEPYAVYVDHRERWELPKELMAHSNELRPGAIGDFSGAHEAIDACVVWMDRVKAEIVTESKRMGHGAPKVAIK